VGAVEAEGLGTGWVPEPAIIAAGIPAGDMANSPPGILPDEASCATGPIYPVRTTLQDVVFPASSGGTEMRLPAGTLVRTAGTYVENGLCDLWPIYAIPPSTLGGGLVDERVLAPAPPPRTSSQDARAIVDLA
jgi:hypothetical protein